MALQEASERVKRTAIGRAKKDLVLALVDCARAIINGQNSLPTDQYNALKRRSRDISKLIKRNTSLSEKKRILQKGGFLSALLGPLLGALF